MPIKFVYFDLGDVICPVINKRRMACEFARKSKKSKDEILDILTSGYGRGHFSFWQIIRNFDTAAITIEELFHSASEYLELKIDIFEFIRIWKSMFGVDERFIELAYTLREQRVGIGIISNLSLIHYEEAANLLPLDLFSIQIYSCIERRLKAESGGMTFGKAVRLAKGVLLPEEISGEDMVFIDDRKENTNMAKAHGISVFHYQNNFDVLIKFLRKNGVDVK